MNSEEFYSRNVSRWHCSEVDELRLCGDNIKDHQDRCVGLIKRLISNPQDSLLLAAKYHDQPETILGDLSFLTKRDFPALALAWDCAEATVIAQYNVPQPARQWERDVVKLVDRMDAYMTAKKFAPWVLDEDDWQDAYVDISYRSGQLGFRDKVMQIIAWHYSGPPH